MKTTTKHYLLSAATACLLIAGIFTPVLVISAVSASAQTQTQLLSLISAAQTSRAYAASAVDYAAAHGLSVSSAQAQINEADSLMASAQADAQSNTNIAAGIQSVQAAMREYAYAATSASVALSNAGLVANVNYAAAAGAIAEVNATASVVASVAAQACTSAIVSTASSSTYAQACADVNAQIAAARLHLQQAASALVQAGGQAGASVDFSQVLSLIATARAEVNATQSDLVTIASYTYSQRGQAFVTAVMVPLTAKANATIKSEQSFYANMTTFQTSYTGYAVDQKNSAQGVVSAASVLATSTSQVNTGAVTSSVGTAQSTATTLNSDLQVLLTLAAITALPNVVADINNAIAASTSYNNALVSVNNWVGTFSQTQVSNYGAFIGTWNGDSTSAQTAGGNYLDSYNTVVSDLSVPTLQGLPQVQAVLNLQVSQTVSAVDASMQQATTAMGTVQTDISSLNTAIATAQFTVLVASGTLSTAGSFSAQGAAYLNATAAAAVAQVYTSVQATAQSAQTFIASASASTQTTLGAFASTSNGLASGVASLNSQTQLSLSAVASACTFVTSSIHARVSELASGQAEVSQALQLFSSQNVSGGAAAMAQAYLELQAAATVSA